MEDNTKKCPYCSVAMLSQGEIAIPRVLKGLFGWNYVARDSMNYAVTHLTLKAFKCPDCGYVMLWGEPEQKEPPPKPSGPDIKVCPHCGARNFRRQVCHKCGAELPDEEKDDRFDYSDKFK